jgi:cellulose synthase/poly-beta-1,6-N-acetylglucosamine synthase-like glycosyltransferase
MTDIIAIFLISLYSLDILALFFFGIHTYIMVYFYRKNRDYCISGVDYEPIDLKRVNSAGLPEVTIQLPVYNEFYVVDRLIDATLKIQWPKEKLHIQVLDDSTDETKDKVAGIVRSLKALGYRIEHLHRTDRTGHKAGALRAGLEKCKSEFIAIFDADFLPAPDILVKTIPYFAEPDVGMVQTRWGHINDDYSMLTMAQSFGIDGHFVVEQVARNGGRMWMNFNGTAGIWRRQCILDAGNWQSDTLTEDFDLSYRAELAGWRFRYFTDIVNPAELPSTIASFKSQQFRWCKGSIQTAVKLIPRILRSSFSKKIKAEAITHLLNYSVHPLMVINILLSLPLLLVDRWTSFKLNSISIAVLFFAAMVLSLSTLGPTFFYIYSQRELYSNWKRRIIWIPVLMMIGTGIAISNTKAFIEALIGKKSAFMRTPKYRIESKKDAVRDRNRYRQPLDTTVILEFLMGIYGLVTIYFAWVYEKPFIIPFMLIYSAGFLYISLGNLLERLQIDSRLDMRFFQKKEELVAQD